MYDTIGDTSLGVPVKVIHVTEFIRKSDNVAVPGFTVDTKTEINCVYILIMG